jgi:Mor family transcriptional regulator
MKRSEVIARANARKYQVQAEYFAGATMQQLADKYGLTRQRIQAMLASVGTPARARGPKAAGPGA